MMGSKSISSEFVSSSLSGTSGDTPILFLSNIQFLCTNKAMKLSDVENFIVTPILKYATHKPNIVNILVEWHEDSI